MLPYYWNLPKKTKNAPEKTIYVFIKNPYPPKFKNGKGLNTEIFENNAPLKRGAIFLCSEKAI